MVEPNRADGGRRYALGMRDLVIVLGVLIVVLLMLATGTHIL